MTFLQPYLLWGLPLALLPVLIHLFNRLRHRSLPWAAMMFLRTATRKSTRYARLRQFLILLFRVLALAALVFAVSRPLAGGWAGWMFSGAPDVILVLLDRSASMETREAELSKREQALRLIAQSAKPFEGASRLILIESAGRTPQEIAHADDFARVSLTAATDTAGDLPAMLQTALDWLSQNKPGSAELWLASDLQTSTWQPDSELWAALPSGFKALPQTVRLRLLALNREPVANASVRLVEINRRPAAERSDLELVFDLERSGAAPTATPLLVNLEGSRAQVDLKIEGPSLRYRHKVPLSRLVASGWGYVELPADSNLRDNRAYFAYGTPPNLRAVVVSAEPQTGRILRLAAAPDPRQTNQTCEWIAPAAAAQANWDDYSLVIWQAPLPQGDTEVRLKAFLDAGGVVVFFPTGETGRFAESGWSDVTNAAPERPFQIAKWEEKEGPLAKTEEGLSLPVNELAVVQRQAILNPPAILAAFEDGAPFLTRRGYGRGQIYFCATQPARTWSELHDGAVLVPLLQRLLETSARRFSSAWSAACGDWQPAGDERWSAVSPEPGLDARLHAGVYRAAQRLVAVNRPAREDDGETLEPARAKALFGQLPVRMFDEKDSGPARLQSELWRLFLFLMAALLITEAILILPEKPARAASLADGEPRNELAEVAA